MGRIAYQKSAGGVLVKNGEVLLIRTKTRTGRVVWTFPKGRIERGERFWEAALREIREETGYHGRLRRRLRTTSYVFRSNGVHVRKTVHWFLVEPLRLVGTPNPREVQEIAWCRLSDAYNCLTYRSDVGLLRLVEDVLNGYR